MRASLILLLARVRLSVVLMALALAGILGGGALIGLPALGACLIFDSLLAGAYGLITHDWKLPPRPQFREVPPTVEQIFSTFRAAP